MWEEQIKIARRQLYAGKFGKAEKTATAALELATKSGDLRDHHNCLQVLCEMALELNNPKGACHLKASADLAEKIYGTNSTDYVDELCCLALLLEDHEPEEAFSIWQRALQISHDIGADDWFLESLDSFIDLAIKLERFEDAYAAESRLIAFYTKEYGADCPEMDEEIDRHVEILEGLGRTEEASELEKYTYGFYHGPDCSCGNTEAIAPDALLETYKMLDAALQKNEKSAAVKAAEDAIKVFKAWAEEQNSKLRDDDPFKAIKIRQHMLHEWRTQKFLDDIALGRYDIDNASEDNDESTQQFPF